MQAQEIQLRTQAGTIELIRRSGASCRQVTLKIGVAPNLLTRWAREAQPATEKAFPGTGRPRDEELARLKRELARVTKERDFSIDAAAYFDKESSSGTRGSSAAVASTRYAPDVPLPEGFCQWLLRLAELRAKLTYSRECMPGETHSGDSRGQPWRDRSVTDARGSARRRRNRQPEPRCSPDGRRANSRLATPEEA